MLATWPPGCSSSNGGCPDWWGEQAWRDSGLGAPDDIDRLHQRISSHEAEIADIRLQLDERTEELAAARLANRELMTRLNLPTRA